MHTQVKKSKFKRTGLLMAVLALMISLFAAPVSAYAQVTDEQAAQTETEPVSETEEVPDTQSLDMTTPNSATPPAIARGTTIPEAPDGTGTAAENSDPNASGKQFVTVKTKSGKIFYLIVDYDKASDNVYLLTEVSENDLLNFVETETPDSAAAGQTKPITPPSADPEPEETDPITQQEQEPVPEPDKSSNLITGLVVIAVIGAAGAAYYFFKIRKNKKQPLGSLDELEFEDEFESEEVYTEDESFDDDAVETEETIDEDEEQEDAQ